MGIVTSISIKLLENFVGFIAKKIEEYFIPRIQGHVGYLGFTAASALLLLFVVVNFFGWKLRGNLVNSILEKIGEYCVPQIIREQVGYLTDYDSNMKTLEAEVEKLDGIQNKMQHSVDEAINNGQRIGPGDDRKLKELKRINEEVKRFLDDEARVNKRCLCGLCPDLISRYKLSSEVKKKTQDVIELQKDKTTRSIFADFESRIKIVDEIMAALKDDNINAIGICGLGGMGKTTTVKKIDERAKAEKLFDVIVMAVVSQNPDLKNIQNEIADKLGLTFNEQSLLGRADRLRERLLDCKRVLVILDDVWVRLDLEAVGIPFGGENQGCKVMLTSRSEDVCKQMRSHKNFKIDALSEPEAWDLFKENAGNSIESPGLHSVAKEVVNECGGLPLAIVTVGRALANEAKYTWNDALRKLRMPNPENVPDFLRDVYGKLELSYDFIKDQEEKSLLLLCCIFEEDTDIPIRDLVRYGMGLLMFRGINALAVATDRVRTLVDNLKRCNLLLDNGEEDCVRMHDVVRDVIRFKATKGKEAFMLRYGPELKEWPTEGTDEQYASVSLISNEIHDHPKQLARPKPDLLLLEDNLEFEGMEELKVLQKRHMVILSLPSSLSYLTNLRALCLHNCRLESISAIGELQTLLILSFRHSSIDELPQEIGKLTHLQLLDLTDCTGLKVVSPGVIKSLIRLEELYLENSGLKWVVEEAKAQNEVTLAELGSLSKLRALVSRLPTTKFSGGINLFDKLVRFQLISYKKYPPLQFSAENEFQNVLALNDIDATTLADGGTQVLLKKTNSLKIRGARGMEHVLNNHDTATHRLFNEKAKSLCELRYMDVKGCKKLLNVFSSNLVQSLQNLEELKVQKCDSLEVVFDFEGVNIEEGHAALVLPGLKKLELQNLPSLTYLWPSQEIQGFQNLQSLVVTSCQKLKYIFTPSIAKLLVKLENLWISECATVEIVGNDQEGSKENKEATKIIVFPKVKHLHLGNLPDLVSFGPEPYTFKWPVLKELSLSNANVKVFTPAILGAQEQRTNNVRSHAEVQEQQITFPSLEVLEIVEEDNVERILNDLLPADSLCKLKQIHVFYCENLSNAVPSNLLSALQNLEELNIEECDSLVEIFEVEGLNVEEGDRVLLPNLKKLDLEDLPKLKHILKREPKGFLFFQSLSILCVQRCKNLRNLFSPSMVKSIKQLQELEISYCEMMTEIVAEDEGEGDEKAMDKIEFPQLRHLTLEELPNLVSFFPKENTTALNPKAIDVDSGETHSEFNLHTHIQHLFNEKVAFPSLEELELIGCGSLRNVFYPSMAIGLVHLKYLHIYNCKMMEEIVVKGENKEEDRTDKIVIPQLKKLKLTLLPSLTCFCQGLYPFDLPSLMHVYIDHCPKMMTFSLESPNTPKLQKVDDGYFNGKSFWMGDLNKTILQLFVEKFTYLGEMELRLSRNNDVELILHSLQPNGSLCKLRKMHVEECNKLLHVVTSNLLQSLENLEKLTVLSCASLVEVFEVEGLNVEEKDTVLLPKLKKLHLKDLTELKHLFNEKVLFPTLEKLILFQGLKSVRVECCNKLLHVIPSNLLQSLENLEELTVLSCASLVEVFKVEGLNVEERDTVLLPKLKKLHLKDLTELKHVFNEKVLFPTLEKLILFQGLKSVRVECCNKLLHVIPSNLLQSLENLEELTVLSCASLVEVFEVEGLNVEERDTVLLPKLKKLHLKDLTELKHVFNEKVLFPTLEKLILFQGLKSVRVECCNKLLHVIPSNLLQSLENLEKLTVLSCASLVEVFEVEGLNVEERDTVLLPKLKKLHLKDLTELKHLFNEKVLFPSLEKLILFQGLKSVRIERCGSLRNLFYPLMAKGLVHLEELRIEHCDMMEQIISKGEEEKKEGMNTIMVIPRLKCLELYHLPNLVSFCQGRYDFDLPSLVDVFVFDCPKMKTFSSEFVNTKWLKQVHNCRWLPPWRSSGIRQSSWMGDLNNTIQQLFQRKQTTFPSLEVLEIVDEDNVERILNGLLPVDSLCKLRQIRVFKCNKLSNAVPSNLLSALQNLEELSIEECDSLVEVFEVEGLNVEEGDRVLLPNLKKLIFQDLPKLKHIVKREPKGFLFFQRLEVLQVWRCKNLRNLFSPSMVKSVEQLQELQISVCKMMTEIVAKDEGEGDEKVMDKIEFPQLRRLTLWELPNLVSFSPKVNTTALNPKAINLDSGEFLPKFKLHTQIQHLFNEKVAFPHLEELVLTGMSKINEIWCKMDHEGTIGFQYLKSLRVSACGRLRNVFYRSMARGLVHLEDLSIFSCQLMKEIVVKGENEEEDRTDKIVIPQLEKLELSNLPSLISFCQGLYPFDLPSLIHVSIDQCPKMTTFSLDSPITPKLQKVDEGYYSGKSLWMGDLNKTIQQLFARKELEQEDHFYIYSQISSSGYRYDFDSSDEEDWIKDKCGRFY